MRSESISKTLLGLVSHYSPSGQESTATGFLQERMNELGYKQVFLDEAGNIVGIIGDGPRQIILLGHIDTVPGEISVRIEDGKIYARGSVDAKGPLAAFTDAAASLGHVEGWQIIVIGAVCEETDSRGAHSLVDQYKPDFAVIGEPSSWNRITLGYKGCSHANITVRCGRSHSAAGNQSACEKSVDIWQKIAAWTDSANYETDRRFDQLQNSLLGWTSGRDGFEEWATMHIEGRLPLSLSPEEWLAELKELTGEGIECVQTPGTPVPAYRGEKNTALVRSFLKAIRAEGGRPGFVVKTGTADMNIVGPVWGCPVVAYGPGDSNLDHTPDEHLVLEEYDRAVKVLEGLLRELTSA